MKETLRHFIDRLLNVWPMQTLLQESDLHSFDRHQNMGSCTVHNLTELQKASLTTLPGLCTSCHSQGSGSPPLSTVLLVLGIHKNLVSLSLTYFHILAASLYVIDMLSMCLVLSKESMTVHGAAQLVPE